MKLVVAIVHNEDAGALVDALLDKEFRATRLHSSGGFLKQSNATILLGVEDAEVEEVMGIVRENCTSRTQVVNPMPPIMEPGEFFMPYPLEVEVGGATVFVVPGRAVRAPLGGRPMAWTPPAVGARGTWTRTFRPMTSSASRRLTGDRNPLHFDADFAARTPAGRADRPRRAHDRPVQRARRRGAARARRACSCTRSGTTPRPSTSATR